MFRIDFGFNSAIDFCIWVLELDGLLSRPFNQHLRGNGLLSKQGMDRSSWKNWLATVVALQDPILTSEAMIASKRSFMNDRLTDVEKIIAELKKHLEWADEPDDRDNQMYNLAIQIESLQRQYQAALSAVKHLPENPSYYLDRPFAAFLGSKTIKQSLAGLWQEYKKICQKERIEPIRADRFTKTRISDPNYRFDRIEYLNIYLEKATKKLSDRT
ncbi:MAG: hypothetical protein ACFBSE_23205 [Prochloraceae cyanobacterium]